MLTENPWNGGGGYTPAQVAEMTPDQIYFRLCEIDMTKPRGSRVKQVSPGAVPRTPDGKIRVRTIDGRSILVDGGRDGN